MRLNVFNPSLSSLGLDIGDTSIRAVELVGLPPGGPRVAAFSETTTPKGIIVNDAVMDASILAKQIRQAFEHPKQGIFTTRNVVVNLPESKCFVRVIHIPRMSEQEAESAVPVEAESYIPIPIDQVYLDWQRIREVGEKDEILLMACPKEFVDTMVRVVEQSGLVPVAFEVECQSIARVLVPPDTSEHILIADIASSRTDLISVESGSVQFTSTIPIAGQVLTEAIARDLGVSGEQAEKIKKEVGIGVSEKYPKVKDALLPVLNSFVSEIKNILAFHDQHASGPVTKLLLAGSGARLGSLVPFLTTEFADRPGLVVAIANPWTNSTGVVHPFDEGTALSYVTALGLAARPTL